MTTAEGGKSTTDSPLAFIAIAIATIGLATVAGLSGPVGEQSLFGLPSFGFIANFLAVALASLAAVLWLPRRASRGATLFMILAVCVAARAALLPFPESDDVYRYLWEGHLLATTDGAWLSPYVHAPLCATDPIADAFRTHTDPFWAQINHPEMTAIYPPLMLLLFGLVTSVSYSVLAMKALMVSFDIATLLILLRLLDDLRLDRRWALIYGLNPVILFAFAGQAHLDSVSVFLMTASIYAFRRKRWLVLFLLLGLAFQAKYVACVTFPLFLRRDNLRYSPLFLLTGALPFLAFLPGDGLAVFDSLLAFGQRFSTNGPIHGLARHLVFGGDTELASTLCLALFALAWVGCMVRFHPGWKEESGRFGDPTTGCLAALGAFLLLSPTVHFWYLSWLVPLLALRPTASWLLLTATVAITFVAEGIAVETGSWQLPIWAQLACWAPPMILLLVHDGPVAIGRLRAGARILTPQKPPETVSVVIPTLDEGKRIGPCIAAVLSDERVLEVLVVDGGSTDETRSIATEAGAKVLVHEAPIDRGGGRGGQIAAGARVAQGDVLAVVHADTIVAPGALSQAVEVLRANREIGGGALGSRFSPARRWLRLIESANDLRALTSLSFGDQVQFWRRDLDRSCAKLPPALPLMEDVELSLRLHWLGRTCFLFSDCRVSARKWEKGAVGRALLIIGLVARYLVRRPFGLPDTVKMYRRYYG